MQYMLKLIDMETKCAPEEAESIFNRGNQAIEDIKGHVSGIRYNACKMREANRKVSELEEEEGCPESNQTRTAHLITLHAIYA